MLPTVKAYRSNGDVSDMLETDAKAAATNHPREWSLTPWTAAQVKQTQREDLQQKVSQQIKDPTAISGKSALDLRNAKLAGATSFNDIPIE